MPTHGGFAALDIEDGARAARLRRPGRAEEDLG